MCLRWTFSAIGNDRTSPSTLRAMIAEISRTNGTTSSTTAGVPRNQFSAAAHCSGVSTRIWPLPS